MDGEKDAFLFNAALVALGLILGHAHPDQGADNCAYRSIHSYTSEHGHDRTCRHEGTNARDRQQTDACQPSEGATDEGSRASAGYRALRCLGVFSIARSFEP